MLFYFILNAVVTFYRALRREGIGFFFFFLALPWLLCEDRASWLSLGAEDTVSHQDPQHVEKSRRAEACKMHLGGETGWEGQRGHRF